MRHAVSISRVILGLIFFVFGLNGFLNFIPMTPPEGAVATFMGGLAASGYFFPLLKLTEAANIFSLVASCKLHALDPPCPVGDQHITGAKFGPPRGTRPSSAARSPAPEPPAHADSVLEVASCHLATCNRRLGRLSSDAQRAKWPFPGGIRLRRWRCACAK